MSALSIQPVFPIFTDIDGQPLEDGYIWIGQANLDPQTNPISVFFDAALTIPAAQPIRTLSGYPARAGSPGRLYVNSDYSIRVMNKNGTLVYSAPAATERLSSNLVTFIQAGAGAVQRTIQARERDTVHVTDFIPPGTNTSTTPCQSYFQAAIDSITGGTVFIPKGVYLITAPILIKTGVALEGEGDNSQLLVNTDIEVIYSDRSTLSSTIFRAEFCNFFINKTVTGPTANYDIHLYNPNICYFDKVRVKSGHDDNVFSQTNKGGIWLDCSAFDGGSATAFMNYVKDCWIQNNSLYLRDITDTEIDGGFYWGHTREFTIRIQGGGAIGISNIAGLIASQYKGGVWLDSTGSAKPLTMIRIQNNFWDGSYNIVRTGYGIYSDRGANMVNVVNNTFWACEKHQIYAIDPIGWTITGNGFFKGNDLDDSQDDIRIESVGFPASRNTVTANAFFNDVAKINKGYAINEVNNGGGAPASNNYTGNTVLTTAAYLNPPIRIIGDSQAVVNTGDFLVPNRLGRRTLFGITGPGTDAWCGISASVAQLVAANGTLDLEINSGLYFGAPIGFVGHLYLSTTRENAPGQSSKHIYTVLVRDGTDAVFTSVASQNGTIGAAGFTLSMASNGVIRFTDTSGQQVAVSLTFFGTRSLN
jgi:hypothetical protein